MRLVQALASLVIAGATALACGNTESNDDAGAVESIDDLLHELALSLCRGDCDESVAVELEYTYARECLEIFTLVYDSFAASFESAVGAGKLSFDAAAGQRCIDLRAAGNCYEAELACDDAIVGHVPVGEDCTSSDECAGNAHCSIDLECPGTCVATGGLGEPCAGADLYECASGLYCSVSEGVCRAAKVNGEPCANPDECQSSNCDSREGENRCAPWPPQFANGPGEVCDYDTACQLGLHCDQGSCVRAAELDEACEPNIVPCARHAYCAIDAGADEGVCVERMPLGGACDDSDHCATGICDGGTCQEHSGLGGPCVTSARCFGLCDDGECAPYPGCL